MFCRLIYLSLALLSIPYFVFAEENCPSIGAKNTFKEISQLLISRLEKVSQRDPSQESVRMRFEKLGLQAECWKKSFGGIIFRPQSNSQEEYLEIYPETGYTFFVKDHKGETRILSSDLGWALLYRLKDKAWYFHEASPDEILYINTLKVKKDTPYNPQEYEKYK